MWTTVFLAQNKNEAEKIKSVLVEEGVLVKLRTVNPSSIVKKDRCIEILVPKSEVEEAHEIIRVRVIFN